MTRSPEPALGAGVSLPPITEHFGVSFRPATVDDLAACAAIWRDSINDYLLPRNLRPIPDELASITRLYRHLQSTDPSRFIVATRPVNDGAPGGERVIGFASAVERERLWFLSMLFIRPGEQGRGLGRALLERVMPSDEGRVLATATDSMQPISNALYASLGIVPRMPLLSLVGRPERLDALEPLPPSIRSAPMQASDAPEVDELDREVLGVSHRIDHEYVGREGRTGFVYRSNDGQLAGFGYASLVGRIGPVSVRNGDLLWPVMSHLATAVEPRGASAVWVPGAAGRVVRGLLQARFRLEDYPILVCWSEPFADFSRYIPISPGLL